MDDSFFAYLQRLELIAFFSGYPLIYVIIHFITGNQPLITLLKRKIVFFLPYAYALVGTLYLGLQVRNLYPDYAVEHIKEIVREPYLMAWGLLAILFWIPALAKKPFWSLLHSLVFFFLFAKNLFLELQISSTDKNIIRNDMKLYTDSLLLNAGAFIIILLIKFLLLKIKSRNHAKANS